MCKIKKYSQFKYVMNYEKKNTLKLQDYSTRKDMMW